MEANNLFMQYVMRVGAEELPPRMQMPVEQQTDEFYNALLERLFEGRKACQQLYHGREENPEALY